MYMKLYRLLLFFIMQALCLCSHLTNTQPKKFRSTFKRSLFVKKRIPKVINYPNGNFIIQNCAICCVIVDLDEEHSTVMSSRGKRCVHPRCLERLLDKSSDDDN